MRLKYLILTVCLCGFAMASFGQKGAVTYYMTADGQLAADSDVAAFSIRISPSDSVVTPKLYQVAGFYKDGRKLLSAYSLRKDLPLKLQGPYTTFFRSGKPMSVRNYEDGEPIGSAILYYPNGKFYNKITTAITPTDTTLSYEECRDSTGKVLTQNGSGEWITFGQDFSYITAKGRIKNFKPDSIWTFVSPRHVSYNVVYKNGEDISTTRINETTIFTSVEKNPEFPGGIEALYNFLGKNIRYPATAREHNTQGRVIVQFVVERDGSLSDVHVVRGIGDGCDEEAVRVIKLSPRWVPGIQGGRPVRIQFSVPIQFTITK